jgi:predicted PurR-regulated permease PerM
VAPNHRGDDGRETIVADLDMRSVAALLAAFVALLAVSGIVRSATRTLTWLTVGALLALALDPLVSKLEARVGRRSVAVGVVVAGFLVALASLVALFGPPAARQARNLSDDLPQVVAQLDDLPIIGGRLAKAKADVKIEDFLHDLPGRLAGDTTPLQKAGASALSGAADATVAVLAALTLLLDGSRLLGRIRRLIPPARRPLADRIGNLLYRVVAQYFAGSVLVAAIAGVSTTAVGLVLGVPLAPLAGAWVAVFDLVPQIGGAVGGIPFVMLGFVQGPGTGVICAVFFVLYLQFENHILSPLVVGRSVSLSPPATMTAALVGVSAAGVVGALVAVPLLGAAKAIYLELRPDVRQPVVGDEDRAKRAPKPLQPGR